MSGCQWASLTLVLAAQLIQDVHHCLVSVKEPALRVPVEHFGTAIYNLSDINSNQISCEMVSKRWFIHGLCIHMSTRFASPTKCGFGEWCSTCNMGLVQLVLYHQLCVSVLLTSWVFQNSIQQCANNGSGFHLKVHTIIWWNKRARKNVHICTCVLCHRTRLHVGQRWEAGGQV